MRLKMLLLLAAVGCSDSQAPATPPIIAISPTVSERKPSTQAIESQINAYASSVRSLEFSVQSDEGNCAVTMNAVTQELQLNGTVYEGFVPVVRGDSIGSYPRTEAFLNRTAGGSPPVYSIVPMRVTCGGSVADTTLRFVTPPLVRDTSIHLERQNITEVHNLLRGGGLSAAVSIDELTSTGVNVAFESDATTHYLRIGPNNSLNATIIMIYRDRFADQSGLLHSANADTGFIAINICDRYSDPNVRRC